jgi:hypothetical protein
MTRLYTNSHVTVRAPDRRGDNFVPRIPEIEALLRIAYGDPIPATNKAAELYDPEYIVCSGRWCEGRKKHYTEFDRDASLTWRFCRDYRCKSCRKRARLDPVVEVITAGEEARLRAKPNKRRKKRG